MAALISPQRPRLAQPLSPSMVLECTRMVRIPIKVGKCKQSADLTDKDPMASKSFRVVDRDCAPSLTLFRRPLPGPELDLVENFLPVMPLFHAPDSRVTVLREPSLESGFPDLVVVVWREARTASWGEARKDLVPDDLRLMHYIFQRRRVSEPDLVDNFGLQCALDSIERLLAANLVRSVGRAWVPCALVRTFAATKIIAIEAKIGKWTDVLIQARLNTWFASKSYVLVPRVSEEQVSDAQRLGIGILSPQDDRIREWPSARSPLPRSYASWIVNDLAWRASQLGCPSVPT